MIDAARAVPEDHLPEPRRARRRPGRSTVANLLAAAPRPVLRPEQGRRPRSWPMSPTSST